MSAPTITRTSCSACGIACDWTVTAGRDGAPAVAAETGPYPCEHWREHWEAAGDAALAADGVTVEAFGLPAVTGRRVAGPRLAARFEQ